MASKLSSTNKRKILKNILQRDNFKCGICGEAINPDLPHTSRLGATIDHIVPKNRGGTNNQWNLQPAHRGCNCERNDRESPNERYVIVAARTDLVARRGQPRASTDRIRRLLEAAS
ncbi:MAG: HNH endonuclease [Thaumarchaeota archaeon]|nr:HNH endonuclease [Nitrososphaerota archaeon]